MGFTRAGFLEKVGFEPGLDVEKSHVHSRERKRYVETCISFLEML